MGYTEGIAEGDKSMTMAFEELTPEQRAELDRIARWHGRALDDIEQRYHDDKSKLNVDLREALKQAGLEAWSAKVEQ